MAWLGASLATWGGSLCARTSEPASPLWSLCQDLRVSQPPVVTGPVLVQPFVPCPGPILWPSAPEHGC